MPPWPKLAKARTLREHFEMYSDCHIHCSPDANGADVLKAMDAREMDRALLIAPHMADSNEDAMRSIDIIAESGSRG